MGLHGSTLEQFQKYVLNFLTKDGFDASLLDYFLVVQVSSPMILWDREMTRKNKRNTWASASYQEKTKRSENNSPIFPLDIAYGNLSVKLKYNFNPNSHGHMHLKLSSLPLIIYHHQIHDTHNL